jgi:hypothetical protein
MAEERRILIRHINVEIVTRYPRAEDNQIPDVAENNLLRSFVCDLKLRIPFWE